MASGLGLRSLGTTGLIVSPIGLGLAALGRPGYINLGHADDLERSIGVAAMAARTHRVLDAALAAGIRYFDAARSYGRAEQFLGTWLRSREIDPAEVTVGSKWGYTYTADWQVDVEVHEVKQHSLDVLQRQYEETQSHLQGQLDLYQIHSATLASGVLENRAVLAELARIKADGIAIGLTVSGPQQAEVLELALGVQIDGQDLFDTAQVTWNLLERSTGAVLAAAYNRGMGIIVKEALANGRLTEKNDGPTFAGKMQLLREQARRLDTTVDALALAAVLAQPWAGVVLSGAARVDHLHSNVNATKVRWDEEVASVLAGLVEAPEVYWEKRRQLDWN
jgi:aryl-alcohol dehydrogenase-like predicted oxidoreductase